MSNFKKSISLLMVLVMAVALICATFTSCSNNDQEVTADIGEDVTARKSVSLTVYGVTNDTTTPEAIKEVEKQLNRISEKELSTTIVLKLYPEDEYKDVLETAYTELQQKAEVADFCAATKKIVSRVDKKRLKLLTEAEQTAKSEAEQKKARELKEAEQKEAAELEAAIKAGIISAPPIEENQIDVLLINDFEHYMSSINNPSGPLLVPIDNYLRLDSKILTDYLHPTLLSAAKIGGKTYGLPINKGIEAETTYCLIDKTLAEKYNFDTENVKNFANVKPFLLQVRDNEKGVIPLLTVPEEIQGYDFYDNILGHPVGITNPEFGEYNPVNVRRSYSEFTVRSFFDLMADFRKEGFFPGLKEDTAGKPFAMDLRKGTASDAAKWEEEGYVVCIYKNARATTENTLGAMYAISTYSKIPDRAMEVIELLYTNPEFKNIFTFGIENVHYTKNNDGTVKHISNDYSMDFMKSGNTFIGLLDEGMDTDYVKKAAELNFNVKRHGFLAFQFTFTDEQKAAMDYYVKTVGETYSTLRVGVANAETIYTRIATRLEAGSEARGILPFKEYLLGTTETVSDLSLQFSNYVGTLPLSVTMEEKDLTSYIALDKNK
ncbi:MAG: hypothetical protein IJO74_01870 [Clostridia bacterium]|nr:hypothetical protein [Clostridia bacterium]